MAQIVKLRRSSVSGQKPTNSNLQLGELALNTTDGKVYMAKSGSLGPSVEELISTNTVNTGSISLIGDITSSNVSSSFIGDGSRLYNIPLSGVTNLTTISGSIDSRLDNLETLSQSYTGSLYADFIDFNKESTATIQSGRLKWSIDEGTLSFGANETGVESFINQQVDYPIIFNDDTVNLVRGTLVMVNPLDISQGDKLNVIRANSDGTYPSKLIVGILKEDVAVGETGIAQWFGKLKNVSIPILEDNNIKFSGQTWFEGSILYADPTRLGGLTNVEPTAPNLKVTIAVVTRLVGNNVTLLIRPQLNENVEELNNVKTNNISSGDLLVKSGSVWINTKQLDGSYGLTGSLEISGSQTIKGLQTISGSVYITEDLIVLGSSSLQNITASSVDIGANTINLNTFLPSIRYGGINVFDSGSSGVSASLLWDSQTDNWVFVHEPDGGPTDSSYLIYGPLSQDGMGSEDILVGNYLTKVENNGHGHHLTTSSLFDNGTKVSINNNTEITGSLTVTGGINGTLDYSFITNTPTLVSGSSQIEITGTTGYSTFSSSISSSVGELSSSVATTTNDLGGRLDSIEGVTGSYATTGSNQFNGNQSISGSVNIGSGSLDIISPEILHVGNSGSYNIARFDGYDNDYAQINVKNHHSGSGASGDVVITADNGTENIHYVNLGINSSNYNAGYVGYENDAYLLNAGKDLYVGTIGGINYPSNLNLFAQNKWETPQILVSGSGQVGFNTLNVTDGYEYEFSGSIKANHSLDVIGGVSASIFTGSYIGDGYGLYNIPASGVTGLELNKIISGSVSASIQSDGTFRVNGDTFIDGTITAREIYIDYVTSSVLYESGSTKFGDSSDDNHNFTGSVFIDGGLVANSITGSINFNNLTNLPTLVSGSSQILDGSGIVSSSIQISYTGITDIPNGIVSGSEQISYTGITDTPNGIVSGSQQVIDLGFTTTSSFESFTSSYVNDSSSFDTRINTITGSITNINSDIDSLQLYTGALNNFTSSFILDTQTSSMTVLSASYAVTAAFALNGGGGAEGRTAKLEQTISSTTWTFNHNLGEQHPAIVVFNEFDEVIIPGEIYAQDENTLIISFSSAQSGVVTATVGGGLPFISGSFDGYVLSVDENAPTWKGGLISGSLQISEFGFATTGSNTFTDDQTIQGTLSISTALVQQTTTTGVTTNTVVAQFPTGSYDGGFFDYVIKDGISLRAGTVTSVWTFNDVVFNEVTTNDLGDTTNVSMVVSLVSGNANLTANVSSGNWTIKVLSRGL